MPELNDMKREKAEQERKVESAMLRHASAKKRERERKRGRNGERSIRRGFKYINFQLSRAGISSVRATIARNEERRAIYRACRSLELTRSKRDSRLFLVETWRWCWARHLRKCSFRINSPLDYRYRLLRTPCFSSACNTELIRSARNRRIDCIPITMPTRHEASSIIRRSVLPVVRSAW